MAIATAEDLRTYMSGIKMTVPQIASAGTIIQGVQEELELYINRPLEITAMREAVVTDETGFARLSVSPIREIRRVIMDGSLSPASPLVTGPIPVDTLPPFDGPTFDVVPLNLGRDLILPGGVVLGSPEGHYIVDYVGGGGDFIGRHLNAVRNAILRVAAREWQIMHDDTVSLQGGSTGEPVDRVPVNHKGWMEEELMNFDRLRRRTIV